MTRFNYLIYFLMLFCAFKAHTAPVKITIINKTRFDLLASNAFTKESFVVSPAGSVEGNFRVTQGLQGKPFFVIQKTVHDKEDISFGYYRFKIWHKVDLDVDHCKASCTFIFNPDIRKIEETFEQDEKEGETPDDDVLKMWPIIVRFANEGAKNVSILFGDDKVVIAPKFHYPMMISKVEEVARVALKGFFSSSKPSNIMSMLTKCASSLPDELSVCTFTAKDGSVAAKIEHLDLKPFFSSRQELLESFLMFEKQKQISTKVPVAIDKIIASLPFWQEKGSLHSEPLFVQLEKFGVGAQDTVGFDFFSQLYSAFAAKLRERDSLLVAAEKNDWSGIIKAMNAGADVEQKRPSDGRNVLHIAAEQGLEMIVRWLLEHYRQLVNSVDNRGYTPLYVALKALPYEMESNPAQNKIKTQHGTIRTLFFAGAKLRLIEGDEKESNPLAEIKIGNNLSNARQVADLVDTYGDQNLYEDLGKGAIWSLSRALTEKQAWALNFSEALDYIGLSRRLVAYAQEVPGKLSKSYVMGLSRFDMPSSIWTPLSAQRQGSDAYAKKIFHRYKAKEYHNNVNFSVYEGPYEELASERKALEDQFQKLFSANVCHLGQRPQREPLTLCCIDITDENSAAVSHTRSKDLDEAMKEMTSIFDHIITDPEAGLEPIARLHWWLAQTTPHIRGGGAVAEWMAIALMLYKGIDFHGWAPQVETWSEAMLYSEQEFVKKYPEFLQRP